MMKPVLTALALFSLAACASAPAYGPASSASSFGYRDQQIETGRYRVSYRALGLPAADDGALRRAAEIAVREGADWFRVVSRDVETQRSGSGSSIGIGGATGGRSSSVGVGVRLPLGDGGRQEVTVRLEILLGTGEKSGEAGTYDAKQVLGNLGGTTLGQSGLDADG